jgi:hypothetical protein
MSEGMLSSPLILKVMSLVLGLRVEIVVEKRPHERLMGPNRLLQLVYVRDSTLRSDVHSCAPPASVGTLQGTTYRYGGYCRVQLPAYIPGTVLPGTRVKSTLS